ncbi:hypothetical protein [Priestia koreensis]|uniref:Uncharacterized protein n=1 Tax=Priestia koreensis TaxID=284581 RepID=A0A0M0L929_9BACI|nr:hypothetical protein [Priestia koreensis]KOO47168.1 hypothetical protein AMD01_06695 [Priestia koreensis]
MKRLISFLVLILGFGYIFTPSAAASVVKDSDEEVSKVFTDFIDQAYNNLDGLTVLDSKGYDMTQGFINYASQYYSINDYKSIQDKIVNDDLSISVTNQTEMSAKQYKELGIKSLVGIKGENVSKIFYHRATDATKTFTKEWTVTLTGSFSYQTSPPFNVTSVSGPRVTLSNANFGAMFSPALEGLFTRNSHSSTSATFYTNYSMRAVLGVSVGSLPIGLNCNFGSHTDTFSAHPSVLQ